MELGLHKGHNLLYYECTEWKTPERTKCRDEKDFELLQALADSRNITKAADKLYITQSALSKRIRAIERELGGRAAALPSGYSVHPSGEAVLAHSRAAAREMDQMRRNLDALQGVICAREFEKKPLNEYLYISRKTDPTLEAMTLRWMNENRLGGQNAGFCVDSITACVEMVKRGLGWGIVPEIGLKGFDGCVRPCIFENGEPFVRKTYLMCQKEALALPQVNAFVELLKKYR